MHPPLTTVTVSGRDIGRTGADMLLHNLRKTSVSPTREIRVAEDLIIRGSTAPPKGAVDN